MVSGGIEHFEGVTVFKDENRDKEAEVYEICPGLKVRKTQRATEALNEKVKTFETTAIKYLQAAEAVDDGAAARSARTQLQRERKELGLKKKSVKEGLSSKERVIDKAKATVPKLKRYEDELGRLIKRTADDLDTLIRVVKKLKDYDRRIIARLEACCCGRSKPNLDKLLSKAYGFVLLESNMAARYCVYRLRSKRRRSLLSIFHHFFPQPQAELAPGEGGLDWTNIVKNRVLRVTDTIRGSAALGATLCAFTVFQILIASLANADSWTTVIPALESWQKKEVLGLCVRSLWTPLTHAVRLANGSSPV